MKLMTCVILASALLFIAACDLLEPPSFIFKRFFGFTLPNTAEIEHYARRRAGFDVGRYMVIGFQDDQVLHQLIEKLSMTQWTTESHRIPGVRTKKLPAWWNTKHIYSLPEIYERIDDENERYWWIWVDRKNSQLFIEWGRW